MINISDPYMRRVAEIESAMNPMAANPRSSAKGLFQFIDSTAQQYGITDPFDTNQQLSAMERFTEDNRRALRQALGREPTPAELYLAHQQGAGGAIKLLTNPDAPVTDVIGQNAALLNAGNPNMTAGEFSNQWLSKFGDIDEGEGDFIEIETPDGIVEFPASMSDAEIEAALQQLYPPSPDAVADMPAAPPEQTFLGGIAQDLEKRGGQLGDIYNAFDEQTYPETALQIAGTGAGAAGDVIGRTFMAGLGGINNLTGGYAGSALGALAQGVGSLPTGTGSTLGEALPQDLEKIGGAYDEFAQENPRAARNIGAIGNIAAMAAPIKVGKPVAQAGKAVKKSAKYIAPDLKVISADDLAKEASKAYKYADDVGGFIDNRATNDFIKKVGDIVKPQSDEAKLMMGKTPEIDEILGGINNLRGRDLSLKGVQEMDEILTKRKMSNFNRDTGSYNEVGEAYRKIQESLRDMVDDAIDNKKITGGTEGFEALKEARKIWSTRIKVRNIEEVIQKAELAKNPDLAIKSGIKSILNNPKKIKAYSAAERDAMRKIAKTGKFDFATDLLKSTFPSLIAAGTGNVSGSVLFRTGALGAREALNARQLGRASDLGQLIARGGVNPPMTPQRFLQNMSGGAVNRAGGALEGLGNLADTARAGQSSVIFLSEEERRKRAQ